MRMSRESSSVVGRRPPSQTAAATPTTKLVVMLPVCLPSSLSHSLPRTHPPTACQNRSAQLLSRVPTTAPVVTSPPPPPPALLEPAAIATDPNSGQRRSRGVGRCRQILRSPLKPIHVNCRERAARRRRRRREEGAHIHTQWTGCPSLR